MLLFTALPRNNLLHRLKLSFVGFWEFRDRLATKLSGDRKQKLALAAGILHNSKVFFLDEPTTGVDLFARRDFWKLLYSLNQEGMTVVVVASYMDEAELCYRRGIFAKRPFNCNVVDPTGLISSYPQSLSELSGEIVCR